MSDSPGALVPLPKDKGHPLGEAILSLVARVPDTDEPARAQPQARAQSIARAAARQASLVASSMALPPGALGWLTLVPELLAVWRLQAQMVADIAGVYGTRATLTREQMLYCLFKHLGAQLFRDVVVRAGERVLVRSASDGVLRALVRQLGIKAGQGLLGKGASRLLPVMGAVGVGAYAYFDTRQVARTAMELFSFSAAQHRQPA